MERREVLKTIVTGGLVAAFAATGATAAQKDVVLNKTTIIDALVDKQNKMAGYVDYYVYLYGRAPTLNDLVNKGVLHPDFKADFGGSIAVTNNIVRITNTKPNTKQFEVDYYNNNTGGYYSVKNATLSGGNGTFVAEYPLSSEAMKSMMMRSKGYYVSPNAPSAATSGKLWYDPLTKTISYSEGGRWVPLDSAKTMYVLRSQAELPSAAVNGDIAIVIDLRQPPADQFKKFVYVRGAWKPLPQNIPFSYNGGW